MQRIQDQAEQEANARAATAAASRPSHSRICGALADDQRKHDQVEPDAIFECDPQLPGEQGVVKAILGRLWSEARGQAVDAIANKRRRVQPSGEPKDPMEFGNKPGGTRAALGKKCGPDPKGEMQAIMKLIRARSSGSERSRTSSHRGY